MAHTRRHKALVIDDDELARRLLRDALAAEGFDVVTAADGTEGVHALLDLLLGLDLLVLDVHLPGLDGEQLLRLVREPGGERDLPIVMVSGDGDPALSRRLAAEGADAVVAKASGTGTVAHAAVQALRRRGRSPLALG